jgi:hypothetical protein
MLQEISSPQVTEGTQNTARFLTWLVQDCGYQAPRILNDGRYACIMPLMFTHAIIVGRVGDFSGYSDRWCYSTKNKALKALEDWNGVGEPEGWHRHPMTGRRKDPETGEVWINP